MTTTYAPTYDSLIQACESVEAVFDSDVRVKEVEVDVDLGHGHVGTYRIRRSGGLMRIS